jgi:H+/Cl- antiporter ClcA
MDQPHKRNSLPWIAAFIGLALFGAFIGWAFYASESLGGGWESLRPVLPAVILGLIAVGGLTGVLMWLAFYSSRNGYDEPFEFDDDNKP